MGLNVWMIGGEYLWVIEGWEEENEFSVFWGVFRNVGLFSKFIYI